MIKVSAVNIPASSNITTTLNGASVPFTFDANSGMINCSDLTLEEGDNPVVLTIENDCSNETIYFTITYEAPVVEELVPCGPRFNPGNADWQFCLVTPSGTYNREDLVIILTLVILDPQLLYILSPLQGVEMQLLMDTVFRSERTILFISRRSNCGCKFFSSRINGALGNLCKL